MRDWETIRTILEEVDKVSRDAKRIGITRVDIAALAESKGKLVSEDEFEVLSRRFVYQSVDYERLKMYASSLTSDGNRLLELIRDTNVWVEIESRAKMAGLTLTPELALLIGDQVTVFDSGVVGRGVW